MTTWKLGHVRSKCMSQGQILEKLDCTLEAKVYIHLSFPGIFFAFFSKFGKFQSNTSSDFLKPYGITCQKMYYFQILLNTEHSCEQDEKFVRFSQLEDTLHLAITT